MPFKKGDRIAYKGPNDITIDGDVVIVHMAGGKNCVVNKEDYPLVSGVRWYKRKWRNTHYATTNTKDSNGVCHTVFMHRIILNTPTGYFSDHISGDGLDNRRNNLRIVTMGQNNKNHMTRKDNTSGYNGVSWSKKRCKWIVHVGDKCVGATPCLKKAIDIRAEQEAEIFAEFARK